MIWLPKKFPREFGLLQVQDSFMTVTTMISGAFFGLMGVVTHNLALASLSLIFLGRGRKKPAQDLFSDMLSTCPHIAAPHRCCALIEVEEKEKSQIIMTQNLSMLLSKIFHPPDRSLQFHSSRLVFLTLNKTIQPWPSISLPFMQPAFQN